MTPGKHWPRLFLCVFNPTAEFRLFARLGLCLILFGWAGGTARAAWTPVAWGDNASLQSTVPNHPTPKPVTAIAGGAAHSLTLERNGVIVGWGDNSQSEITTPSGLTNAVALAAGDNFSLALQQNGSVRAWGSQITVPAGLTNTVAIAASLDNKIALTADGNVVAWGAVPLAPGTVTNAVAIAAGEGFGLALIGDGTVATWGDNATAQGAIPTTLTNVVALAAGASNSLALQSDGTVVAWGDNTWGQSTVPTGLSNVVAIAAGARHSLALRQDGTVFVWGDNTYAQLGVPSSAVNVATIAAGRFHSLAIVGDGSPFITVQPVSQYNAGTENAQFTVMAAGTPPLSYQWWQDGASLPAGTNSVLALGSLAPSDAGSYWVVVSNSFGAVTSAVVRLPPLWRRPAISLQPQSANVNCGDSVSFRVAADGTAPLAFQWQLNGTNILGATNTVLTQFPVSGADAGTYTVVVSNINGVVTSQPAVLAVAGQQPLITSPVTASGKQGVAFNYTINGLHSPNLFLATGLPYGLSVNTATGQIQGTPLVSGSFVVTLATANDCASAQTNLVLNIASSIPVITSGLTANGTEETPFTYQIHGSDAPSSFTSGALPQGLTLDPATGIISGSPLLAGTYPVTISASNVWGVGSATLQLKIANAPVTGLAIANLITNYSAPYLLNFQFSLRDNSDPTMGNAVVADPSLFTVTALEDGVPVSPTVNPPVFEGVSQGVAAKVLKAYLVLDYTESIALLDQGTTNQDGTSGALGAEVTAAEEFVQQQPTDAEMGVYEFHREDESPNQVMSLTTDKNLLENSIAGIWTNYVKQFPAGSRCWDALGAAIQSLGTNNPDEEHAVVFCSNGLDTSSTNTPQGVIAAANAANVQVYCVGVGNVIDSTTLQSITSQTLGRYYEATNLTELAGDFAKIGKDVQGQYFLRWATLNRNPTPFQPSFQITYQGYTAYSPTNPPPFISGTNYVIDTNAVPPATNAVYTYSTNYLISPYLPSAFAGDVTVGSLRLASDADVLPSAITLRATYVPRYIQQMRLHYRANWPCTVSLQSTNPGEQLAGWTLTQTNDGAGGQWAVLATSNPNAAIPFASFGPLLSFTFHDVLNASNAFSLFAVDNTIYTNQTFVFENVGSFVTVYPTLPHGTPVPWLIQYGFSNPAHWIANETNDVNGNGYMIWQDYVAGLNPTNTSSTFKVGKPSFNGSPGHCQISFGTAPNRTYRVITSTNLVDWQIVQDGIAGTGGTVTITDNRLTAATVDAYYRVQVY
jgi:hypothetical protein